MISAVEASLKPPEIGGESKERAESAAEEDGREDRRLELLLRCRFFGIVPLLGNICGLWRKVQV